MAPSLRVIRFNAANMALENQFESMWIVSKRFTLYNYLKNEFASLVSRA